VLGVMNALVLASAATVHPQNRLRTSALLGI
jgi:hypothetical protein